MTLSIRIQGRRLSKNDNTETITFDGEVSGPLPRGMTIGSSGILLRSAGLTGDPELDREVAFTNPVEHLPAYLDPAARGLLVGAVGFGGWRLEGGRWTVTRKSDYEISDVLHDEGRRLGEIFLLPPDRLHPELVERATTDPLDGVRRRAIRALVKASDARDVDRHLLRALDDPSPLVRLEAMRLAQPGSEAHARVPAALAKLVAAWPHEASPSEDAPDYLELRVMLAHQLGKVPAPVGADCERVLGLLIASDTEAIARAAFASLDAIGTLTAVPLLLPYRNRLPFLGGYKKALAKDIILRIQARAGNPDAGRLALASGEGGGLALRDEGDDP